MKLKAERDILKKPIQAWASATQLSAAFKPTEVQPMKTKSKSTSKTKTTKSSEAPAAGKQAPSAKPARPSADTDDGRLLPPSKRTKIQQCLDLLTARDGATIDELKAATGWQAHSVRGFLSGTVKKKLSLILDSTKAEDGTATTASSRRRPEFNEHSSRN